MVYGRFYPTATKLPDGRILAMGGSYGGIKTQNRRTQEIYDPATGLWTQLGVSPDIPYYPNEYILPDGRMVVVASTEVPTVTRVANLCEQHVVDGGRRPCLRRRVVDDVPARQDPQGRQRVRRRRAPRSRR